MILQNSRNCKYFSIILALQIGCAGAGKINTGIDKPVKPGKESTHGLFNFMFVGYDTGIKNPGDDSRSFYKIFIDKVESGRTTIGLESQKKYFNSTLSVNRHLIRIEKWALDRRKGKYVKLNNINQPKPDFIYFEIEENKILKIRMISHRGSRSDYKINKE